MDQQILALAQSESVARVIGPVADVSLLCPEKPIADATTKFRLRDHRGRSVAVALCGRGPAGDLVTRNVERANEFGQALGPKLGSHILTPVRAGSDDGMAYSIYSFCRPVRAGRLRGLLHRRGIAPHVLEWLRKAAKASRIGLGPGPGETGVEENFRKPLQHLEANTTAPRSLRGEAGRALDRLERGQWSPCHVLTHYDLWSGNIMIPRRPFSDQDLPARPRFVIIDWAGALRHGYGVYDLVRIVRSMRISPRLLHRELRAHCRILGCAYADARSHLVAGLASLGMRLEHFAPERHVQLAHQCLSTLSTFETQ